MPELTAQDIHEMYLQVYQEVYIEPSYETGIPVPQPHSWETLNKNEIKAYTRLAELINEKLVQKHPETYKPGMEYK